MIEEPWSKNDKTAIAVMLVVLFLCLCFLSAQMYRHVKYPPIAVRTRTDVYVIEEIRPPKHVYVKLRRESDNEMFYETVSKHWNNHKEYLWVGRKVKLTRTTWRVQSAEHESFDHLRSQLER
jgi:hypothetical protein